MQPQLALSWALWESAVILSNAFLSIQDKPLGAQNKGVSVVCIYTEGGRLEVISWKTNVLSHSIHIMNPCIHHPPIITSHLHANRCWECKDREHSLNLKRLE